MRLKRIVARTAVLGAAAAGLVLAGAGSATAASGSADSDITVRSGKVVLTPAADGGYTGQLNVQVHYEGPQDAYFNVAIDQPEGLYFLDSPDVAGCVFTAPKQGAEICGLIHNLEPGETRTISITYRALAAPQAKTRLTTPGQITVTGHTMGGDLVDATPADNTARFVGVLSGTGTGIAPRPYRPAEHTDTTLNSTAGQLTFAPNGFGGYHAEVPATVGSGTDAYHQNLAIELVTPVPGLDWLYLDPTDPCVNPVRCGIGVGMFAEDTTRTIQLGLDVRQVPPAGTVLEFRVLAYLGYENNEEVYDTDPTPTDNIIRLVVA